MPTTEPDRDRRVIRTRRDIAVTVRTLLVDEGWEAITHQRVADHSGYGRNTIYRHFPDRTALLLHAGIFGDDGEHSTPTGEPRADLLAETMAFRDILFDGPLGTLLSVIVERAERDPDVVSMRDQIVAAGTAITRTALIAAQEAGAVDPNESIDALVARVCGPVLYARLCMFEAPSDHEIEQIVNAVFLRPND